jgi:hypothetical protein
MNTYRIARIFLSILVFSITVIITSCGGGGSSSNPTPSEQTYNVELKVSATTDNININAITIGYNVNGNEKQDINITDADMPWTKQFSNVSSGANVSFDIHYDNIFNGILYTDDRGTILVEILVDGKVKEQQTLNVTPSSYYVKQEITVALQETDWSD